MIELSNWSFARSTDNRYIPDDLAGLSAQGNVKGHPRFNDGDRITTSNIREADGRELTTRSGSKYILVGEPDPNYVNFLDAIGKTMDHDNPVTFINVH